MTDTITFEVNASDFYKKWNKVKNTLSASTFKNIFEKQLNYIFVNEIKRKITGLHISDTGNLRRNIFSVLDSLTNKQMIFKIVSNAYYSIYVEKGTGIHATGSRIGTKGIPWLAPMGIKGKGGIMFRWTSGIPARPYFLSTVLENLNKFYSAVSDETLNVLRGVI